MVDRQYKIKTMAKGVLGCLLFIIIGLGLIFIAKDSDSPLECYIAGTVSIVAACGALVYSVVYQIFNHERFWQKQVEAKKKLEANPYFQNLIHPEKQDMRVIKLLWQDPVLGLPYFASIVLFVLLFALLATNLNFFRFFRYFGLFNIIIIPFILGFIGFSCYILGYLALGEILKRRFSASKRNFLKDLAVDYIYAIPFIIILSFLWLLFIFVQDKKRRSFPSSIRTAFKRLSLYSVIVIFKYYTYINLAIIAFEDRKTYSLKESFDFFVRERAQLFGIWFRAGFLAAIPFLLYVILFSWNSKFHFINEGILFFLGAASMILYLLFGLLSEQISFLLHFIAARHKEYDKSQLLRD